jgi:uncharacterized protein (TIGR02118 family)
MLKVTVLYGHPTSSADFEKYYAETHLPLAAKMQGVARLELTKFVAGPDGGRPAFYRMAELYFPSQAQMQDARIARRSGNGCRSSELCDRRGHNGDRVGRAITREKAGGGYRLGGNANEPTGHGTFWDGAARLFRRLRQR